MRNANTSEEESARSQATRLLDELERLQGADLEEQSLLNECFGGQGFEGWA